MNHDKGVLGQGPLNMFYILCPEMLPYPHNSGIFCIFLSIATVPIACDNSWPHLHVMCETPVQTEEYSTAVKSSAVICASCSDMCYHMLKWSEHSQEHMVMEQNSQIQNMKYVKHIHIYLANMTASQYCFKADSTEYMRDHHILE
jgi:nitric oxide reductase large subunit